MTVSMPQWQDFKTLLAESDQQELVVAWHCSIPFDVESSVALAWRFRDEDSVFCLESATQDQRGNGRYSFIGFDTLVSLEISDSALTIAGPHGSTKRRLDLGESSLTCLDELLKIYKPIVFSATNTRVDDLALCNKGGFVGFLSYDQFVHLEPQVPLAPVKEFVDLPDSVFYLPRNLLILDHYSRKLAVIRYAWIDKSKGIQSQYATGTREFAELLTRISAPCSVPALETKTNQLQWDQFSAAIDQHRFMQIADICLESIRSGDIYQIQIANRLSYETKAHPLNVFRHLRMINPSPYMAYYKYREHHIVCASPELMVSVHGNDVIHRPIAGTRKRHWEKNADAKAREELQTSVKERAEHVMLVDLARNDIGRVAIPGTVSVTELIVIEEYSHVFHLVSEVTGKLRPGISARLALEAGFPNGTVVGAPKIKAAQLIATLEVQRRQFYAGSLGIFDFAGGLNSTLLIRTIYMSQGMAATQAAAGIVYDSVPQHEWQETRNKMSACLLAMQNTL